jgi:hypothetical protein
MIYRKMSQLKMVPQLFIDIQTLEEIVREKIVQDNPGINKENVCIYYEVAGEFDDKEFAGFLVKLETK